MTGSPTPVDTTVDDAHGRVRIDTGRPGADLLETLDDEIKRLDRTAEVGAISLVIVAPRDGRDDRRLRGQARRRLADVLIRLDDAGCAVLTGVEGHACGWEVALLLAGDLRVCSEDTILEIAPTDPPAPGLATQLRRRGIDPGNLLRWSEPLDAEATRDLGLVHECAPTTAARLDTLASSLTDRIAAAGIRAIRSSLRASAELPHQEAIDFDAWL